MKLHANGTNIIRLSSLTCLALLCLGSVNAMAADGARVKANESAAVAAAKTFAAAQDIYRRTDWDKDGVLEYTTKISGNFSLFEQTAGAGDIALVSAAFAKAAGSPVILKDKDIPKSDKATDAALTKLIPGLAADEYAKRVAASKAIEKLGPKAIRTLQKLAEEVKDPEAANRCRVIAEKLRTGIKKKLGGIQVTASPKAGYCFKVLTGQGSNAPGGKKTYINGKNMTLGYSMVAFPAEYGKTGRNSFIINNTGTVYQKDLGKDTVKIASEMTEYDPDTLWVVSE